MGGAIFMWAHPLSARPLGSCGPPSCLLHVSPCWDQEKSSFIILKRRFNIHRTHGTVETDAGLSSLDWGGFGGTYFLVGAERQIPSALRGKDVGQVEERLADQTLAVLLSEETL